MRFFLTAVTAIVLLLGLTGPASAQNYSATLEGSQEVPPNASSASGTGLFTLDGANLLHYNIVFSGTASETGAHIHGAAPVGVNAGIVFALPLGNPKIGFVGPLTAAQVADLNAGLYYVNIHSTAFPGGEIRGQILATVPAEESSWGAIKELYDSE
jgi:hypothetical protein